MCLLRDDSITITGNKVWKKLLISKERLVSSLYDYWWVPGWNIANLQPEDTTEIVNYGFHVHLKRPRPQGKIVIVEFTFEKKDLIAVGRHSQTREKQAVFKRLHLSKEEYLRVISLRT